MDYQTLARLFEKAYKRQVVHCCRCHCPGGYPKPWEKLTGEEKIVMIWSAKEVIEEIYGELA